jgi:hypothetical protein
LGEITTNPRPASGKNMAMLRQKLSLALQKELNQEEFLKLVDLTKPENLKLLALLRGFFEKPRQCHMCRHRFENTILKKENAKKFVPLIEMFSGEFLFHLKETHGLIPYDFFQCIEKATGIKIEGLEKIIEVGM